jgi:hypothetical protein
MAWPTARWNGLGRPRPADPTLYDTSNEAARSTRSVSLVDLTGRRCPTPVFASWSQGACAPFLRDLTWASRLRATPAAALAAVLTLALGTGVNTAVFAVAYGVLLRPLPCPEPSRIVVVSFHAPNGNEFGIPLTEIEDWQRRVRTFQATGAYHVAELTIRALRVRLVRPLRSRRLLRRPSRAPAAGRAPAASDPDEWMLRSGCRVAARPACSRAAGPLRQRG